MNLSSITLMPIYWYALWAICVPLCLTIIPPKPYRAYISCFLLFSILIKAQFFFSIDPNSNAASIALILQGTLLNLFFYTFNLFVLVEYPELTDFRPGIESLEDVRSLETCTWKKFKWCVQRSILVTVIGQGWNWQISSSCVRKKKVQNTVVWLKSFILYKLILRYTLYDIFFHLYISTDYIKSRGWGVGNEQDLILFSPHSKLNLAKQLVLAFGSVYCVYFGIETLYDIFMILNVFVFKTSTLNDYLPLFGSFNNSYTVRSLWGNVWHKLMYQLAVPQSQYLSGCDYKAKHLNVKRRYGNEKWRTYLMFFFVFVFTGIYHASGTLNMPWSIGPQYNTNIPFAWVLPRFLKRCFYSFIFFPMQFVLIIFETLVQGFYKKYVKFVLPKSLLMVIGLAWIAISEVYLLQLYIDELVKSGFNIEELLVPVTPVHVIFQYFKIRL